MAKKPCKSPQWCKWWCEDWAASSLRRRLKTAAKRGIYRELWDICMSSPDPGSAVDSAGAPYSDSELAEEIGCRLDHLRSVLSTCYAHGRITVGARDEHRLCASSIEKSLPPQINLAKRRERNNRHRFRKADAAGAHTLTQWHARVDYCGWRCRYCGISLTATSLTKDHVIPLSKGGSDWPSNLVPSCRSCNSRKKDRRVEIGRPN